MKLKEGFILQEVAGDIVVLPVGSDLNTKMMITLNKTGGFLWKKMEEETTKEALVEALLGEYGIDRETAQKCVDGFVESLEKYDLLA